VAGLLLVVSAVAGGCSARHPARSNPFVKAGKPLVEIGEPLKVKLKVGTVRPITDVRPASTANPLPTVETSDPELSAALARLAAARTPDADLRVAERYRELGILDMAHDHFLHASELDRESAAAYEGLARIWRDWGFPQLGLADASRAVFFAPSSASAHNTLGTLLASLSHRREARKEYERAVELEPRAAYALNNLCYLSFLEGDTTHAMAECQAALAIDPDLTAARDTLASLERTKAPAR
jgi:tetratricopeptide (TPR) repeat protein